MSKISCPFSYREYTKWKLDLTSWPFCNTLILHTYLENRVGLLSFFNVFKTRVIKSTFKFKKGVTKLKKNLKTKKVCIEEVLITLIRTKKRVDYALYQKKTFNYAPIHFLTIFSPSIHLYFESKLAFFKHWQFFFKLIHSNNSNLPRM